MKISNEDSAEDLPSETMRSPLSNYPPDGPKQAWGWPGPTETTTIEPDQTILPDLTETIFSTEKCDQEVPRTSEDRPTSTCRPPLPKPCKLFTRSRKCAPILLDNRDCDLRCSSAEMSVSRSTFDVSATGSPSGTNTGKSSSSNLRRCSSASSLASDILCRAMDKLREKGIQLPKKDKSILELMIKRQEGKEDEWSLRDAVHESWRKAQQRDALLKHALTMHHWKRVNESCEAWRLERESLHEAIAMEEATRVKSQEHLIVEKERRWMKSAEGQAQQRRDAVMRMKTKMEAKKACQAVKLREIHRQEMQERESVRQESERRLVSAVSAQQARQMLRLWELQEANRESLERHAQRRQLLEQRHREEMDNLVEFLSMKEQQAAEKRHQFLQTRDQQLKHHSWSREERADRVKEALARLSAEYQAWARDLTLQSDRCLQEAEQRASKEKAQRSETTRVHRLKREFTHGRLLKRIENENQRKLIVASQKIQQKDQKVEKIVHEKEITVKKSRDVARATSELRMCFRQLFQPETFDRKALQAHVRAQIGI